MRKASLLLTLAFVAAPVGAKAVYLDCAFPSKDGAVRNFAVAFDEDAQTMSYTTPTGYVNKLPNVVFNPNEVIGSESSSSSGILTVSQWQISRVTGAAIRTTTMSVPRHPQINPGEPFTDNGTCSPVKAEVRKF
jgi:hypothetical protein